MRVCVVGAGAVGGYVAAKLAIAGHDVTVIARGATLAAIQEQGLRVAGQDGARQAVPPVEATDRIEGLAPADVVVLAVKAHQIAALAPAVAGLLAPHTGVVALQNGLPWWYFDGHPGPLRGLRLATLDPGGVVSAHIPARHVIGCVTWGSFERVAPGIVAAEPRPGPRFTLGEPDGGRSPRLASLAASWNAAGLAAAMTDDIRHEKWVKAWGNLAFNPIGALCHATVGAIGAFPPSRALAGSMLTEAREVAEGLGVVMPMTVEARLLRASELGAVRSSTQQDVEAGRGLEVDALLGAVIEIARHLDVATPHLDAVYACTRLLDRVIREEGVRIVREPLA